MPVTAATFLVAVLAIAGIFPFAGFWSKDEILQATLASGRGGLYAMAMVTVFLTAFYMSRVFFVAFTGKAREAIRRTESPPVMTIPLLILAILAAFLGFAGSPWLSKDIHAFLEPLAARQAGIDLSMLLQSNGLALAGILAAFLLLPAQPGDGPASPPRSRAHRPRAQALRRRVLSADHPRAPSSPRPSAVASFDRHVVDGTVNLVGGVSRAGGGVLRRTSTGKVQSYALIVLCAMAAGARLPAGSRGRQMRFPLLSLLYGLPLLAVLVLFCLPARFRARHPRGRRSRSPRPPSSSRCGSSSATIGDAAGLQFVERVPVDPRPGNILLRRRERDKRSSSSWRASSSPPGCWKTISSR